MTIVAIHVRTLPGRCRLFARLLPPGCPSRRACPTERYLHDFDLVFDFISIHVDLIRFDYVLFERPNETARYTTEAKGNKKKAKQNEIRQRKGTRLRKRLSSRVSFRNPRSHRHIHYP